MVSTRGLKFKFSEGERVLCYEPDPTKAKVLYDSKVLEVKVNKDQRGRKAVEFLIHFQGWNSSWDRCVTEDYILKDTEDNRQLQKDLAHKAQLQLRGAYLYRRDRTKRRRKPGERGGDGPERQKIRRRTSTSVSTTSTSNTSESNLGASDNENSSSSQDEDGSQWNENDESDNSSCMDSKDGEDESEHREEKIVLELSAALRKSLERDSHLITKQNKLTKIPAVPDVVTILEEFVKHYATTQLTATASGSRNGHSHRYSYKYLQHNNKGRDLAAVCRNLNICKEVADGLRIYFDFTLKPILLYEEELAQAQRATTLHPLVANMKFECDSRSPAEVKNEESDVTVKQECDDDDENDKNRGAGPSKQPAADEWSSEREAARRRTLRSHRGTEAQLSTTNGITVPDCVPGNTHSHLSSVTSTSSRCSTVSPAPVISSMAGGLDPATENILGSPRSKAILSQVSSWHLIPPHLYEQVPAPPSLLYGAIHLTRLFVRLPDLLSASGIPSKKLKVLQTHLENLLGFLEDHTEWFGDEQYEDSGRANS